MNLILSALLAQAVGLSPGQAHPDFSLPKLDETFGRLSDFRGKKLVLIHFASW